MGRIIILMVIAIAVIFSTGCNTGAHGGFYVEDDHHDHVVVEQQSPSQTQSTEPWLRSITVVDSNRISTDDIFNYVPDIDPYIDDGVFEIHWQVDAVNDYVVEYRVNDIPDVLGSRLIDAELCGWGLLCDASGYQFCQYSSDFSLSCDVVNPAYSGIDSIANPLDVGDMVANIPETLYLVVQICDTRSTYCEFEAMPALFY